MTNEILPFSLYFIIIIFFLAGMKKRSIKNHNSDMFDKTTNLEKFLLDSEKKLKALKDLYVQDLISKKVYIDKTEKIAKIVNNVVSKDFYDFAQKKNKEIIDELKNEIYGRFENIDSIEKKEVNIDMLLESVDKKLEKKSLEAYEK